MKVTFKTNIDAYKAVNCFPANLPFPPRIGEKVEVNIEHQSYFKKLLIPNRLEVIDVIYGESEVICELWYNEQDRKISELAGAKTF